MTTTLRSSGITMGSSTMDVNGSAPSCPIRCFAAFNGNNMVQLGTMNVSSISDLGVGTYRVNFGTAMWTEYYAVSFGWSGGQTAYGALEFETGNATINSRSTTSVGVMLNNDSGVLMDNHDINVMVALY